MLTSDEFVDMIDVWGPQRAYRMGLRIDNANLEQFSGAYHLKLLELGWRELEWLEHYSNQNLRSVHITRVTSEIQALIEIELVLRASTPRITPANLTTTP